MSGILRLESLTKGNTLKQGDKTPLKYRLFDADGEKLNIAGKSAKVRLVYPDFLTIGYEKDGLTVTQNDTVTFTIDNIIPSRIYHVEIIVDGQFLFPSRADESKFTVDKSSLGTETNIIEIVGKDVLIREVKEQIDNELGPFLGEIEQAELDRQAQEEAREMAEGEREDTYNKVKDLPDSFQSMKDDFNQHKLDYVSERAEDKLEVATFKEDYTAQFNEGFPSQAKDLMDNRTYTIKLQLSSEGNPQLISKEVI